MFDSDKEKHLKAVEKAGKYGYVVIRESDYL